MILSGSREEKKTQDVSMESLVRQSLLAAQVFNLIPTTKARERWVTAVFSLQKIEINGDIYTVKLLS